MQRPTAEHQEEARGCTLEQLRPATRPKEWGMKVQLDSADLQRGSAMRTTPAMQHRLLCRPEHSLSSAQMPAGVMLSWAKLSSKPLWSFHPVEAAEALLPANSGRSLSQSYSPQPLLTLTPPPLTLLLPPRLSC